MRMPNPHNCKLLQMSTALVRAIEANNRRTGTQTHHHPPTSQTCPRLLRLLDPVCASLGPLVCPDVEVDEQEKV